MTGGDHVRETEAERVRRIARELAALGEPAPDEHDAAVSGSPWSAGDEDVVAVTAMFAAAYPEAEVDVGDDTPLTAMERHRAWKRVAGRLQGLELAAPVHRAAGDARRLWRVVTAALAAAAAVVILPRFVADPVPATDERDHTAARGLATQARRALDELPGERDGARARALADTYARRMRTGGEAG